MPVTRNAGTAGSGATARPGSGTGWPAEASRDPRSSGCPHASWATAAPEFIGQVGEASIAHATPGPQSAPEHTEANAGPAARARTTTAIVRMAANLFKIPSRPSWSDPDSNKRRAIPARLSTRPSDGRTARTRCRIVTRPSTARSPVRHRGTRARGRGGRSRSRAGCSGPAFAASRGRPGRRTGCR